MSLALRRIRGAVGMGLSWALVWAVVGGGIMELIVDPRGRILDMWPQTLAVPGFVCGAMFSLVLALGERRRRFDELSLLRFAAWGAVTGLLVGALALAAGAAPGVAPLLRAAVILGPVTLLSALSAPAILALARLAGRRESLGAAAAGADGGLDAEERLGRGS